MTDEAQTHVFEARPRKSRIVACIIAAVVLVAHVVVALLLRVGGNTGVYFRWEDQAALAGIGVVLAGLVLLFTRPRLRIAPEGVTVRNVAGDRFFPWDVVRGFSFPPGASFAHLELPDYEYAAVMAIQANDGERAVEAIDRARELTAEYKGY
ncbi:PH domain-containing protein [Tsukamurella sp. 8F]|uniref:PH domain-containing protein n=1 Tax=unclassified Tsukamurella TaxID=2633480 RepID=UPI0023B88BDC|nr:MULTISPECIES: PH domain-containing protein [unclassified Tsukamurella]MDF0531043.1 PH domain-containing protein [Tsukamurella sp. 8J]MDF0585490.1 PH domain-containing protein [Tsukamurella sp. 8F]